MRTDYNALASLLAARVPELAPFLKNEIEAWQRDGAGEPTMDYLFGAILAPRIAQFLRETPDSGSMEIVQRVFALFEELLHDENELVRSTIDVSFCEQFAEEKDVLKVAMELMRPQMRESMQPLLGRR